MEVVRAYNVGTTLYFPLIDKGATDFEATPVTIATGDAQISKDGGAFANTGSNFAHEGGGIYSLALTGTELSCRVAVVKIVDQTGTKEWEDQCIVIATCNHASAEIPSLWAIPQSFAANSITAAAIADGAIDAATFAAGAINAAAIAADAITAAKLHSDVTTELQSGLATASALAAVAVFVDTEVAAILAAVDTEVAAIKASTDNLPSDPADASVVAGLISGLDAKLDAIDNFLDTEIGDIKAKTDNLPSDPADASDIAALLSAISGYIDTEVAAIKAKTDLIPAAPAAVGDIPTALQNADALLSRNVSNTEAGAAIHSLTSVVLKLTGRFVGSTGKTYRTDGSTTHMTQVPTTDPAADPITELGNAS